MDSIVYIEGDIMTQETPSGKTPTSQGGITQAQGIINSMSIAFQQISGILQAYGINMYMYKVKLYSKEAEEHKKIDDDCEDAALCIDYVVRIKCQDDYTCNKLREAIKQG